MKVKSHTTISRLLILTGITATFLFSACKKDDPATSTPTAKNIAEIVASDTSFSLLYQAVNKAGLASALSGGSLTVFAPDNAAFRASGISSSTIVTLDTADVRDILKYHVVGSNVGSASVPASDTVKSLLGTNIYASKNTSGVFVNGVKVKVPDVAASNGTIHVISSVLMPPTQTIAAIATATPDLSLLLALVSRAGLAGVLSSAGKYTVFAPTNSAFVAAGLGDVNSINSLPVNAAAAIVKAHAIATNVFASDLIAYPTAQTLQTGVSLTIGTTPPSVKISTSASAASNIIVPAGVNITATNGVVHLIDKVLQQ